MVSVEVMYYVYILKSLETGKMYIGFSSNLKQRVKQHLHGQVHTTRRMGRIELVFYEAFKLEIDARHREKYFKTTKGKRALKIMLKSCLAPSSIG